MRTIALLMTYYGFALYGLNNPVLGLLFFIHITIFRPESLVWGNPAFGRLHLISAFFVLIGYFIHRSSYQDNIDSSYQRKNILIFLGFILWLFIATVLAESSVQLSFDKTVDVVKIFVICFLFAKLITTARRIDLYVWVISISFGMLSLWGFLQGMAGNPRLDTLWPGGSNYIAAQLALMAPFVLAKGLDTALPMRYKLVFFTCTLSIILCCIYTDSRGGFIGLSVGMLVLILQIKQRARVLVGLAVLIILALQWMPENYSNRIASIFEEEERDTSAESRFVTWSIALRIWQDHPIVGVGLENFSPVKETYADKVGDIVTSDEMFGLIFNRQRYPHGLYPGMMAETGLVGLGLFLALLLRNILCRFPASFARPENQHSFSLQVKGAQAGLMGFAVAAFFGDFQYIEMLYLQAFFVGAVRSYADSLISPVTQRSNERLDIVPTAPVLR
jgi:putative inorganic carbon (HCO3(-)) transporter